MVQQTEKKVALRPMGNRVVAQRLEQEETFKGGIIVPDTAKKKQESAKVIAVGPGAMKDGKLEPIAVSVGDVILMDKYAACEVTVEGEEYVIVKADDIIAILN